LICIFIPKGKSRNIVVWGDEIFALFLIVSEVSNRGVKIKIELVMGEEEEKAGRE